MTTFLSARFADPDHSFAIVETEELGAMVLSQQDTPDEWARLLDTVEPTAFVPPDPEPLPVTILYPVDLWSRLTDSEAEAVETAMATQPVRIQNIFRVAASYRSDHELWPLLETVATGLFGPARAAEVLAASE